MFEFEDEALSVDSAMLVFKAISKGDIGPKYIDGVAEWLWKRFVYKSRKGVLVLCHANCHNSVLE